MKIKALQPFVGIWGNQTYVFTSDEEKDVPDGFGESVCRSGTLAIRTDVPTVKAAARAEPQFVYERKDEPTSALTPLTRATFEAMGLPGNLVFGFIAVDVKTVEAVTAMKWEALLNACDGDEATANKVLDSLTGSVPQEPKPSTKTAPVAPLAAEPEPEAPEIDDMPAEAPPVKRGRKY